MDAICAYCKKPAVALDLCHARLPVCDQHAAVGHQLGDLPAPKVPKASRK